MRIQDGLLRVVDGRARPDPALLVGSWLRSLIGRHTSAYSRPEFLKAVRALSSRYVEDRARLGQRSPLDSAGKRAAFAGFYAALHYLTICEVLRSVASPAPVSHVIDLGCGTGVAAIAWAIHSASAPAMTGIDQSAWALEETRWNCRTLGLRCRTRRSSMVPAFSRELSTPRQTSLEGVAIVCAWSLNELHTLDRDRVRDLLLSAHRRGAHVLVVEPLALSAVPWWDGWREPIAAAGGRSDEWRFSPDLPAELAELDEAAGFHRDALTARSFWLGHV